MAKMFCGRCLVLAAVVCLPLVANAAEPYTPAGAGQILLQRVPGAAKALRQARAGPGNSDPATRFRAVQAAIDQARKTGDPRYFGQAQALLGSDWTAVAPPPGARLLRATLLQQRHDFAGALRDLDAVLATDAGNAQARLIRASIFMVQGEPLRARADCAALIGRAGFLVIGTCLGSVNGLIGRGAAALQTIETALAQEPDAPVALRIWSLTQMAEIAERLGEVPRAAEQYAKALQLADEAGDNDVYLKAAHADFLLDRDRAAEVREALAKETDFDPLLLRLAMAEQRLADAGDAAAQGAAALHLKELVNRYALAAERGDPPHLREQAMAALYLQTDARAALQLAQQNWSGQHEPADARLLLASALAAGNKAAARPALDWMQQTGIEDVRLKPLAVQLGAPP